MLNRDNFFKKRDESARRPGDVTVTPALGTTSPLPDTAKRAPAILPTRPESTQSAEHAKSGQAAGSKLIVGPDIKLKGVEITDCDTLVVEGTVEASMDSRGMQISGHGVFRGTVSVDIAEIHGRFEGELTARGHLNIHAGGSVSGKIRYERISIEEGGEICGDIARTEAQPLRASQPALKNALASDDALLRQG